MSKVLDFAPEWDRQDPGAQADPGSAGDAPADLGLGAMGAGLFEPKHARRAEDRDRFDAQVRAWDAFLRAQRAGEDLARAFAIGLDVYHHHLALAAVRRLTGTRL